MTVYEFDLAVQQQHEQAMRRASTQARLAAESTPLRPRLAAALRRAADAIEPPERPAESRPVRERA
jgi:hypothetical protein